MIMANLRIKDLSERTTLASGDYLATDNNSGTRKVDASKILTPISNAQTTADNVATKVSNSGDAFSSSKGYSVGELCIYDNKVYRCKTAYSTGAEWQYRSSYFDQVTLTDAVSDLNNALTSLTKNSLVVESLSKTISVSTSATRFDFSSTKSGYTAIMSDWSHSYAGSSVGSLDGVSYGNGTFSAGGYVKRTDASTVSMTLSMHVLWVKNS